MYSRKKVLCPRLVLFENYGDVRVPVDLFKNGYDQSSRQLLLSNGFIDSKLDPVEKACKKTLKSYLACIACLINVQVITFFI